MTREDKIGQMLMPGIAGPAVDDEAIQFIADFRVGGIWLASGNIHDVTQVQNLIATLNDLQKNSGARVPLFISIDHEGGSVNRFPYLSGITAFPSPMAVAATGNAELAYQMGLAQAQELRLLGINMNLAPVLDVNINPLNPAIGTRSFGSDPAIVTQFGMEYLRGLKDGGIIGVGKHFPGHGNTTVDSHRDLPVVDATLDVLEAVDLVPFRVAVSQGVPAIMMGHLLVPALDPDLVTSLSPKTVDGYLRDQLGFGGLVVADDIEMGAIVRYQQLGNAAILAVQAGADLIPIATRQPTALIRNALLEAVNAGQISEERINQSVRRILRLKLEYGLLDATPAFPVVEWKAHDALAAQIGAKSITLILNDALPKHIPLGAGTKVLLISPQNGLLVNNPDGAQKTDLGVALANRGMNVTELIYQARDAGPQEAVRTPALNTAAQYGTVIVGTWDAALDSMQSSAWQRSLVRDLLQRTDKLIVVGLRSPYDLRTLPGVSTYLVTYGSTPSQLAALAQVLSGYAEAQGELPVPLQDVTGP
jgi:beta-N-acetylhexosaminidase